MTRGQPYEDTTQQQQRLSAIPCTERSSRSLHKPYTMPSLTGEVKATVWFDGSFRPLHSVIYRRDCAREVLIPDDPGSEATS